MQHRQRRNAQTKPPKAKRWLAYTENANEKYCKERGQLTVRPIKEDHSKI